MIEPALAETAMPHVKVSIHEIVNRISPKAAELGIDYLRLKTEAIDKTTDSRDVMLRVR